ncbi:Nitric oxide synthase oxygenase [Jannaschia seosinensis]|uniref:Nitric oxide synthase oxygenase n=1 Tax=Jannaschia seosinensis TaxID=313367 RepID=A0A0M7BDH5_9RHOB|nr:nitric oxide synthase oxygenase [Jannaschia seosinensis]CUH39336.1 Nitric oxide synthase oxygenase [Jannaschia seosinensis]
MVTHWRRKAAGRDHVRGAGALSHRLRRLSWLDRLDEARAFLELHARSHHANAPSFQRRWAEVRRALMRHGHYDHTPEELAFGAKLAWRNHAGCIGRLFWDSLLVRDRRNTSEPEAIFSDLCRHLEDATGDGRIRSIISIYPPMQPGRRPSYVESAQLIRYAGYLDEGGCVIGDRKAIEATRVAQSLGWNPPDRKGPFDILPVVIRDADERRHLFNLPSGLVREVPITHPHCPEIAAMGLRWYAVPVVSDMILTIGGIDYPCAPFNGFYMCTEIASRNFADRGRYDLLPKAARRLQLDPDSHETLWKDATLTELNRAVLHSYQAAGVTMVDHHTASDQFMQFLARESATGRRVSGDWTWLVPPQASSACEVFHHDMTDLRTVPNFYRSRGTDGARLMPHPWNSRQSRLRNIYERVRHRARLRQEH